VSLFFGAETESLERANACVVGLCWDRGSSLRKGSAKAPKVIRDYTNSKLYNSFTEAGLNLKDHWRIYDVGDLDPASIEDAVSMVENIVSKQTNIKLNIFFGGDHSITYATLKALKETSNGSWGLVYFDSHPDLYEKYDGDPYSHACTLRRVIDDRIVNPKHIVQVGIRAATAEQLDFAKSIDMPILSTADVCKKNAKEISSTIKNNLLNVDNIYTSFDIDVLDPAFAPGVGNPEGGGLTSRNLIDIIHGCRDLNIKAFDVVEANPDYDCAGVTFYSLSKLIRETLGVIANPPNSTS
jgi:agmatinase